MTALAYYCHMPPSACPVRELRAVGAALALGRVALRTSKITAEAAGWGGYPCPSCGRPLYPEK